MAHPPLVVVGDSLLDVDVAGTSDRLCPDAPVPVVDVQRRWLRPGGAALAALLAARAGVPVTLITAVAADEEGEWLLNRLKEELVVCRLPLTGTTVTKTRVAAGGGPLVRLDSGTGRAALTPLPPAVARTLAGAGAVLVSDYGRGVTAAPELRRLLQRQAAAAPVVWDPHPRGSTPVPGAALVTPNLAEARALSGSTDPQEAAIRLLTLWRAQAVAVTQGAVGALLVHSAGQQLVPVPAEAATREPLDTCGAGDRFASAAAAALATGVGVASAVAAAVAAASRFVAAGAATSCSTDAGSPRVGPAPVADGFDLAAQVRARGGRVVATGGCFDLLHAGHVDLLDRARRLGDLLVVCLNSDASVRRSKGPNRPVVPEEDRARVLAALRSVDAVLIFDEDTPARLLTALKPDVWVKGDDYVGRPLPEADVVQGAGGRVVLVPVHPGRSTTGLISRARPDHHVQPLAQEAS